jgi:DNA-binding transcriptional MerR regulator
LRFYEGAGLITAARTAAGYRTYDAASIETLRFIARAKRLGLSSTTSATLSPLSTTDAADPCKSGCARR